MPRDRVEFLFLNAGHFLDHLFMLISATIAAGAIFTAALMLPRIAANA